MRALVVEPGPNYSVADVHRGIMSGLELNGVTAIPHDLGDWVQFYTNARMIRDDEPIPAFGYEDACRMAAYTIKAACWDAVPDVVIVVSSFFIPPEIYMNLRERGRHVVMWFTESPYEDERQLMQARFADTVIINDPTNIDLFRKQNPRTFHIPHGYDPTVHHDRGRSDRHPFSFVGTGYESRVEFFEKVDWPCPPLFAGNWKKVGDDSPLLEFLADERGACIDNVDTADLYRASVTSANLYRKEAQRDDLIDGWAIGPREVELAMCGLWFCREPRSEGDQLFKRLPKFTDPGELSEQIGWALTHPDERREAVRQAQAAVGHRTFQNNIADLLKIISA